MRNFTILIILLMFSSLTNKIIGRDTILTRDTSWNFIGTLGIDFSQLLQLNPRQGAGQNKIGINGALGLEVTFNKKNLNWENLLSWQFAAQKNGTGTVGTNLNFPVPVQKLIDDFKFNSKIGMRSNWDERFFFSFNFNLNTLLTPTFSGNDNFSGSFFKDIFKNNQPPLSKFLSPAVFSVSLGSEIKRDDNTSFFYSPGSFKMIWVKDEYIASTGVHGNMTEGMPDTLGIYSSYKHTNLQFGSFLRIAHKREFINDRLFYEGSIVLFSNYLKNPQNVDLDMMNTFNWFIYKGFNLSLLVNLFYDDDVLVQITDKNSIGGINGLGKRLSITQQLLISYKMKF